MNTEPGEKKCIKDYKAIWETQVKKLKQDLSEVNFNLIISYLDASAIGQTTKKRKSSIRSRVKIAYLLKVIGRFFDEKNKSMKKATINDIQEFVRKLEEDDIKKIDGKSYSDQTKAQFKIYIAKILKFSLGVKATPLIDWIDTGYKKKHIVYFKEDEVKQLLIKANRFEDRVLIAVLFDGGLRIEEFLNVRFSDITKVDGSVPYFRLRVRDEFSKTQGREISLLWSETTALLEVFLEGLKGESENPEARVFERNYDAYRMVLRRLGVKVLNKVVRPHDLRRSSATYYASKLSHAQLCYRYGWNVGSDVPGRYIALSGVDEKQTVKNYETESLSGVKDKLDEVISENKLIKSQLMEQRKISEDFERQARKLLGMMGQFAVEEIKGNLNKTESPKEIVL